MARKSSPPLALHEVVRILRAEHAYLLLVADNNERLVLRSARNAEGHELPPGGYSAALVERSKEYVEAATCLGIGKAPVMFRHMMRNCLPPLIVVATVQVGSAISLEATLSFLGLGLPVTKPSLGLLISNGFAFLMSGKYWISFYPGLALLITIVAINLVADQLRDVLNPRLKK